MQSHSLVTAPISFNEASFVTPAPFTLRLVEQETKKKKKDVWWGKGKEKLRISERGEGSVAGYSLNGV